MKVFVHGGAATPIPLMDALARRGQDAQLKNVELIHIHTEGHDTVVSPEFDGNCLDLVLFLFSFLGRGGDLAWSAGFVYFQLK